MFDALSLHAFLRDHSALPTPADRPLAATPRVVRAGERLLTQGDAGRSAYIVHSGLLESYRDLPLRHRLNWHGVGHWIGEIAALTDAPRRASVAAWRDSVVLEVDVDPLAAALSHDRKSLAALTEYLLAYSEQGMSPRPTPHILGALPTTDDPLIPLLLRAAAEEAGFTLIDGAGWREDDPAVIAEIERRCAAAPCALWLGDGGDTPWSRAVLRCADRAALIAPAGLGPRPEGHGWAKTVAALARRLDLLRVGPAADAEAWLGRPVYALRAESADLRDYLKLFAQRHAQAERLGRFEMFADLEPAALSLLQEHIDWRTVACGERVMSRGEPADGVYVLDVGRMAVSLDKGDGERRRIGELAAGATVGELAPLTEGKRTADVDAIRDCQVGFLSTQAFNELLHAAPEIGRNLARTLAGRLASPSAALRPPPALIVALGLTHGPNVARCVDALAASLSGALGKKIKVIDSAAVEREVGPGMSRPAIGRPGYGHLMSWLQAVEADHDVTLLVCGAAEEDWTRFCAQQADRLILIADSAAEPGLRPIERRLAERGPGPGPALELFLLHPADRLEALGTEAWLTPRPRLFLHHLREGNAEDMASAARRIMGCAIGVAFSGGVGFAPAHLGVVRAMNALGLPIDMVSGASSGAGIAGVMAAGMTHAQALRVALSIVEDLGFDWWELHPPLTALTSGRRFNRILQNACGDRRIEDQLKPCAFSAVDIASDRAVWLERGPMWTAIRASGSMPIIVPPVSLDGQVLVDGALAAHNPIDPLLPCCERGLLIVSELVGPTRSHLAAMPSYGAQLSGWSLLADRLLPWRKPRPAPMIGDIITRCMTLSNALPGERSDKLRRHPAVSHIRISTAEASGLKVERPLARKLEKDAFAVAHAQLSAWLAQPPFPVLR